MKAKRADDLPTRAELRGINARWHGKELAGGQVPRCRRANGRKWNQLVGKIEAAAVRGVALPGISAAEAQMLWPLIGPELRTSKPAGTPNVETGTPKVEAGKRAQLAKRVAAEAVRAVLRDFCARRCTVAAARAALGISRSQLFALAAHFKRARRARRGHAWGPRASGRGARNGELGILNAELKAGSEGAVADSLGRRRGAERPTSNFQRPTSKDGGEEGQ